MDHHRGQRLALEAVALATPGDLRTISGGYEYARRLLALTPLASISLPGGFPDPDEAMLNEAAARLDAWPGPLLIDGLAYGAFPPALADRVGPRSVVLLHHPLDLETGLAPERAALFAERERRALAPARGVIATSRTTARDLGARFGVEARRLAVAEPGVAPAPRSPATGEPPLLLSVGAVIPRKGHDLLIAALADLPRELEWRLEVVGPVGRAPEHEARMRDMIVAARLEDRVRLLGAAAPAELEAAYRRADIAVLPSRHEGYGMAATEAVARGLPLIAGRGGALAETAAAGLLVDPEDRDAFSAALARMIGDRAYRRRSAEASWAAAGALPRWEDTARSVDAALERFFGEAVDEL